jgi:predicted permease
MGDRAIGDRVMGDRIRPNRPLAASVQERMPILLQDARYALRLLIKRPAFAAVAILTLALGVGATTAIFTVVNAILLKPLPFAEPDRLVHVSIRGDDGNSYPLPDSDFVAWRARNETLESMAVFDGGQGVTLTGQGTPERVEVTNVTDRFFAVLGVPPAIGRTLEPGDDAPGAIKKVVLSHRFWQRRFHGDPAVIGRTLDLDARPHTIAGVMPPSFVFPGPDTDAWKTLTMAPPARRGPFYTWGIGRLRAGAGVDMARANLAVVVAGLKQQYPGPNDWNYEIVSLHQSIAGDIRRTLYLLFGAVAFLLLIATANVANLLLARAAAREREIAVRSALGAASTRIVGQLLVESVVLAMVGGLAALAVAAVGTRALLALAPSGIPRLNEVGMHVPVFLFALATAVVSGILFGLVPALRASRIPLVETLKEGGRSGMASLGHRRMQRALVVSEIALALMLSVGAGLMIRSFSALMRVNPGFAPTRLVTFPLTVPAARYDTSAKVAAFYEALHSRLQALPAVQSVGESISMPPDLLRMTDNFTVEGMVLPPNQGAPVAPLLFVDDSYFSTLGVPLVAGRFYEPRDTIDKPDVVIVNETLAKRYFPGGAAVGRRLKIGGPERPIGPNNRWMDIVGVVGDVKYSGLDAPPEPTFYLNIRQNPSRQRYIVLRSASDAAVIAPSIRAAVAAADGTLAVAWVRTIDELMTASVASPRFRTVLVGAFAALGLLLAAIGIYGVMTHAVSERTHELGVRIALGADRWAVMRLVLGEAALLAAAGVAIGVVGAVAATRLMRSLLFGVTSTDPATFAIVAAVLVGTALAASYIPTRRAARVDPMVALRYE